MRGSLNVQETRCALKMLTGLSPRVRGSQCQGVSINKCAWSIPASAGQPYPPLPSKNHAWVYPRECGAALKTRYGHHRGAWTGLSPRVRGSPNQQRATVAQTQSGLSPRVRGSPGCLWRRTYAYGRGLSPRVRGSRFIRFGSDRVRGTVYPRECGAALWLAVPIARASGLSRECGAASNRRK